MSALDPADDELARAQHQVRALEQRLRLVQRTLDAQVARADAAMADAWRQQQERLLALRLRDESAREHERERARRQAGDVLLANAVEALEQWDWPTASIQTRALNEIRAHLTRQGEAT